MRCPVKKPMKVETVPEHRHELKVESYMDHAEISELISQAKREDIGADGRDVTSELLVPDNFLTNSVMRTRQPGCISGTAILAMIGYEYDDRIVVNVRVPDGQIVDVGATVAEFFGPLRSLLSMERVALNFICHLSGIATLTSTYVQAVANTTAKIYDTRKTLPGLRGLEKYAVACGGGWTHRLGLYDAVLIKDNHLAHLHVDELGPTLAGLIKSARSLSPAPKFIEVEVDTLEQLRPVLVCRPDVVLLDNMTIGQMRQAVAMRNDLAASIALEASGGVVLETVAVIAKTGVDRIAVGAITHSAPALDMGLDIQ